MDKPIVSPLVLAKTSAASPNGNNAASDSEKKDVPAQAKPTDAAPVAEVPAVEQAAPATQVEEHSVHEAVPAVEDVPSSEWDSIEPSEKRMGLVPLVLDKGVRTTAIGTLYGLDYEIEEDQYWCRLFFDWYNKRLKVLDYEATDYSALTARIGWLAEANDFDKIFIKATRSDWQTFLRYGYLLEGILKYYYKGQDAYIMSRFRTNERLHSNHLIEETELIEKILNEANNDEHTAPPVPDLPDDYRLVLATEEHIPAMVALYRVVFATYPSPLTHPDYVLQTMERNIIYRVVMNGQDQVVAAASADIDFKHSNAELTDCATLKSERGKGLMSHILQALETDLQDRGIMTGYTLARAVSVGMNKVFSRLGYEFSGRLVNNCDIYGQFEDMNIWAKRLDIDG